MKFLRLSVIICVVLMSKMTYAQYKNDPTIKGPKDTIRVSITNVDNELDPLDTLYLKLLLLIPVYSDHLKKRLSLTD